MPTAETQRLNGLQRLFLVSLFVWLAAVVVAANLLMAKLQAESTSNLPFGIFVHNGTTYTQDFSYNLLFFHGVQERFVPHPYRLDDQEKLMRHLLPQLAFGMGHAYSPVAFVLVQPLLCLSGRNAYLIYTGLCALATLLLFYFYLLPRVKASQQLYALTGCSISVWVATTFAVGQSSPMTTAFLAGFWGLLAARTASASLPHDIGISIFFWALCLKPSIAIIPLVLLLGAQAWRPLLIGVGFLLITWICVAGYYGGWWDGLRDYLHLLDHFHNAAFTPFMQRGTETAQHGHMTVLFFHLNRDLVLILSMTLLLLRWARRISGSEQFQGMIWSLLLFSPYLLPSENWAIWLLIVEGSFFRSNTPVVKYAKLVLLMCIFDLRAGLTFPIQPDWPLKCVLCAWIVTDLVRARTAPTAMRVFPYD